MTLHICEKPEVETWQPDFSSSEQVSPIWSRIKCGGHVITNSLEWVEWSDNPVQVILCDACGHAGCASGGYVHVSRLAEYVLFTSPQTDADPAYFLSTLGAVAVPVTIWNEWSAAEPANHTAVADAWILGPGRDRKTLLQHLDKLLVGGDTLERDALIDLVSRTLEMFAARAQEPFAAPILSLQEVGARLETLYFDGPGELDWPAFAFKGDQLYLALDREHVTVLE